MYSGPAHPTTKEATIPTKAQRDAKLMDLAVAVLEEAQAQEELESAKRRRQVAETSARALLRKDGPATVIIVGQVAVTAVRRTDTLKQDVVGYRVTNDMVGYAPPKRRTTRA